MKCQILFSGNKKKNINLLSADFAHSTVSVYMNGCTTESALN